MTSKISQRSENSVVKPLEMRRVDDKLRVLWSDQTLTEKAWADLRQSCACAVCAELKTPLNETMSFYQRAIRPREMSSLGNYAVEIGWEDGHRSIVSFERLRTP